MAELIATIWSTVGGERLSRRDDITEDFLDLLDYDK
jgi:hypothetical protein